MTKENYYSNKMAGMSDLNLREYIDNKSLYSDEAILAAIWELEKRNLAGAEILELENQINHNKIGKQERIVETERKHYFTVDSNAPVLYTPNFILVFGVLFSVFGGGILMAINFTRLGKKNYAMLIVFISLLYSILQGAFFFYINVTSSLITLPTSLLGIYLIQVLFWKRLVPGDLKFQKRNIWGTLLIASLISISIVYYVLQNIEM